MLTGALRCAHSDPTVQKQGEEVSSFPDTSGYLEFSPILPHPPPFSPIVPRPAGDLDTPAVDTSEACQRAFAKLKGRGGGGLCGQRCVDSKNSQTTPATTSTSSIRQLLGAADVQTAHHATFSTAPTHQLLGSANAETTPAGAPAAAADRTQRPDATCEGNNG